MSVSDPATNIRSRKSTCRLACRVLWGVLLAVLLTYGILQVWVRTNAFRSRIEIRLSQLTGMEIRTGRIRATESLNLKIRDVISVSEEAGIEARLIRVRWRLFRPRGAPLLESVRVDGLALTFAPDENGEIQPAFLGDYARTAFEWAGVQLAEKIKGERPGRKAPDGEQSPLPAAWLRVPQVILKGLSVRFLDVRGNFQGSMTGANVSWTSMPLPDGGRVSVLDCRAAEVRVVNGPRITGLHIKLIDTDDRRYLAALDAEDWGTAPRPRTREAEYREMLDAMDEDLR